MVVDCIKLMYFSCPTGLSKPRATSTRKRLMRYRPTSNTWGLIWFQRAVFTTACIWVFCCFRAWSNMIYIILKMKKNKITMILTGQSRRIKLCSTTIPSLLIEGHILMTLTFSVQLTLVASMASILSWKFMATIKKNTRV